MKSAKFELSILLSGILWGCISIFIKALSSAGLDSLQICFIRMLVSAITLLTFVLITSPQKLKFSIKDIWIFIGIGIVSVVLFNACYFYTMINSEASLAVVLLYTSPIFIMIMSRILFKEAITKRKILALILTITGCVLVAGLIGSKFSVTPLILVTGLASGFFYGMYTIFGRFGLKKYDSVTITTYTFVFGLVGSLVVGKPIKTLVTVTASPMLILCAIGIGIICTVLPYFLYTYGLSQTDSGKASIIVAVEPLVGSVIGMTFYHESHSALKLIGIALILISILLLAKEK